MKTQPFTDEELLILATALYPSELWNKAFKFYNEDESHSHSKVHLSCRPCFNKVLVYVLNIRFKNNENKSTEKLCIGPFPETNCNYWKLKETCVGCEFATINK
jgi:hypothetical protein